MSERLGVVAQSHVMRWCKQFKSNNLPPVLCIGLSSALKFAGSRPALLVSDRTSLKMGRYIVLRYSGIFTLLPVWYKIQAHTQVHTQVLGLDAE